MVDEKQMEIIVEVSGIVSFHCFAEKPGVQSTTYEHYTTQPLQNQAKKDLSTALLLLGYHTMTKLSTQHHT
jgi:hypothetical protein